MTLQEVTALVILYRACTDAEAQRRALRYAPALEELVGETSPSPSDEEHTWMYGGTSPETTCFKCGLRRDEAPLAGGGLEAFAPCVGRDNRSKRWRLTATGTNHAHPSFRYVVGSQTVVCREEDLDAHKAQLAAECDLAVDVRVEVEAL